MTLTELLARFEERAVLAEREAATAPVANVYRLVLDELRPLAVGVDAPASAPAPERLLTAAEAAARLGVAPRWLYRHARELPFTRRLGPKTLRFSERGLQRHLDRRP